MRRHPPEKRAAALADLRTLGVTAAAKKHGIGVSTLCEWAKSEGIRTLRNEQTAAATEASKRHWETRRAEMVHRIGDAAELALELTTTSLEAANARNAKDAATTMAILVDKAQLLSGGQTSRHGVEDKREVVDVARKHGLTLVG